MEDYITINLPDNKVLLVGKTDGYVKVDAFLSQWKQNWQKCAQSLNTWWLYAPVLREGSTHVHPYIMEEVFTWLHECCPDFDKDEAKTKLDEIQQRIGTLTESEDDDDTYRHSEEIEDEIAARLAKLRSM